MNKFLVLLMVGLVADCSAPPRAESRSSPPATPTPAGLAEAQVLAIARQAVSTNDTWLDRAEFEAPRQRPDGTWSVMVWRLPKTPGGHRVILIDEKGQVKRYFRGA